MALPAGQERTGEKASDVLHFITNQKASSLLQERGFEPMKGLKNETSLIGA